jgi:dihydroorotase
VAVVDGRIAAVEPDLSAATAARVMDVAGFLVTPGLIDLHTHVYAGVSFFGIEPDGVFPPTGVTTAVDAGTAGWITFPGLKRYVIEPARTHLRAYVHLCATGLIWRKGELVNLEYAQVDECVRCVMENPDVALGVKVRLARLAVGSETDLLDLLGLALEAAEQCGKPLMVHITGFDHPLPFLLDRLRPGDVITHCFTGGDFTALDEWGQVLPAVWEARERGLLFDVAHGWGSCSFDVARAALSQGFLPDVISTDLHTLSLPRPVHDLPTTLSKFLHLGMSLEEVFERATIAPARIIGEAEVRGHLRPGAVADVAVWALREGEFPFVDSFGQQVLGQHKLECVLAVRAGEVWYGGV